MQATRKLIGDVLALGIYQVAHCEDTTSTTTSTTKSTTSTSTKTTTTDDSVYRQAMKQYKSKEQELLAQWEKDEEGYRNLPARAWPAYQPDIEDIPKIQQNLNDLDCPSDVQSSNWNSAKCSKLQFELATAYLYNNHDHSKGLQMYRDLAENAAHPDSMCAMGVVLVEGLGCDASEKEGIEFLTRACVDHSHPQAMYELGSAYYSGVEGHLEESETIAFEYFDRASEAGHFAGMFMVADCLMEGMGSKVDVQRAVPLLFTAAESGHRYARQKMRELFTKYT